MPVVRKTSDITAIPIETQFQAILDSLAAHVAVLDRTGVIVTINKAWEDFARANGVNSVAEVGVGVNYLEVCRRAAEHASPEAHQALVGLQAVLAGSLDTYTVEYPCHSPAEKRWFIVNISPMPPEYGGAVVAHFNITERKVAEDSLRTNQAILKAIVEGTTDPMFIKDRQGKYLLINAAGAQVIGKPIEEIIGKRDKAMLPADFAQEVIEDDQRVITTGQAHKFENTVTIGQTTHHFHSLKTPYRNDKGEIVGIIGISRDITELKQVERYNRLLAEAGKVLSSSLDYQSRLSKVAQLAVPDLADWCSVDVLQENEEVHHIVVAHVDPAKVALAYSLQERYPPDWEAPTGAPNVLRTGQSELYPDISDDLLVAAARDEEHLAILRELQMKSAMVVPLVARGRAVGVMTFVWAESNRRYTERDLVLAEELGRRAAISMDNARLYEAERRSRRAAERAFRHIADLQAVTAALSEALTPLQVGKALIEEGLKTIEANSSLIVLLTPESETLKILTSVGYSAEQTKGWKTFPLSTPVPLAECVRTGEPIFISSYEELKARYPMLGKQQTEYNGALASIPLISDAKPIGAIGLSFATATDFTTELRNFLLSLARQGSQAFERARLFTAERFARRAAERANRRIANLQTITASLSEALTPLEIAKAITKKELAIIGAESGVVAFLDEQQQHLEIIHAFGYSPEELSAWRKISISHPENPLAASICTGQPIFIESRDQFEQNYPALAARPALSNHQAILTLPLTSKEQTIGAIGLSFAEPRIFDEKDKNYLLTIAQHCSQALERARLYELEKKARAEAEAMQERLALLAEVKERNRLAGELHDTVAQALGYLNLKMATLIMELEQGQLAEAQSNLKELKQIVGETYTDVREEIFNLRSSFAPGIEFLAALQDYIAKYKRFYDLDIDLQMNATEQDFRFSAEAGIQLIRTIQEALINIRKHAQVNKALLRLEKDEHGITIIIEDEGAGFDPEQLIDQGASSFGLQIMQERIEKVGGRLEIDSTVGRGTRITLHYTHPE